LIHTTQNTNKTAGVYVQVPFCQTKCTYCNFHTGVFSSDLYAPYADAVAREINEYPRLLAENKIQDASDATVDTVYVGGGTPSLLAPHALTRILSAIRGRFRTDFQEVTLEADPETITPEKAAAWRDSGFDRISMGAQSFCDTELKAAGRMHRREDIFNAFRILRAAGFQKISADLIAGLPHQTDSTWNDSVSELLALRPEHISIYLMEIDEGSRLGLEVLNSGPKYSAAALPTDDAMAAFYEQGCERLAAAGYVHYEISNWAFPGNESRHNLKYWRREPYFGFGAGAHSFNGSQRWANAHDPSAYASAIHQGKFVVEQLESVTREQALEEELFLGLRQLAGIDLKQIESKYGANLTPRIEQLRAQGLLEWHGGLLRLAPDRLAVSNEVFVNLLDD
jgi:oxygen-independent coproporphyrinogen III oxidase